MSTQESREEVESLKAGLEWWIVRSDTLEERKVELEQENESLKAELAACNEEIAALENENGQLEDDNESLTKQVDKLKAELLGWEQSFKGHVYVECEKYGDLVEAAGMASNVRAVQWRDEYHHAILSVAQLQKRVTELENRPLMTNEVSQALIDVAEAGLKAVRDLGRANYPERQKEAREHIEQTVVKVVDRLKNPTEDTSHDA